jgi:hypothetical protein
VHGGGDASGHFSLFITSRLATLFDQVMQQELSSPQYKAFDWMTNNDSIDLQSTLSEDELLERFVLVIFYFATNGENWFDQIGFLNPWTTHCSWNSYTDFVIGFEGVVSCNDEGSVMGLVSRKFPHSHRLASL